MPVAQWIQRSPSGGHRTVKGANAMLSSGDGIFDIQLAQHLATLERHPDRQGANKLRSRVDDGLDVVVTVQVGVAFAGAARAAARAGPVSPSG